MPEASPEIDVLQTEVRRLKGLVSDLSLQIGGRRTTRQNVQNTYSVQAPYWQGVERSGGTYTSTTDWNGQFDDSTASNRVKYDLVTATGSFVWNTSSSRAFRHRFVFDAALAFNVAVRIVGENWTANAIQIQINGVIAEYSANRNENWYFRQGRNVIDFMSLGNVDRIELRAQFLGGGATWVNPNGG